MGTRKTQFNPETDLPNLSGKVAIVTGANGGIGIYTVLHLARRGAKVYLGARNEAKAKAAIERLKVELGLGSSPGDIKWLDVNLADPRAAKRAAANFLEQEHRLDILINNAGKTITPYGLTQDGLSDSMVINHLSPAAFTLALLPLMKKTASEPGSDVRIVNLTSQAHKWIKNPRYDTPEHLNCDFSSTWTPQIHLYAYTKTANILWTSELQRRFDAENIPIVATSIHPGSAFSEGNVMLFSSLPLGTLWVWLIGLTFSTSDVGSHTTLFAAACKEVKDHPELYKGRYLVPFGRVEEPSEDAKRADLAKELWHTTERMLANF